MNRAEAAAAAIVVFFLTLCGAAFACAGLFSRGSFYPGARVESADLSASTLAQAQGRFSGMEKLGGTVLSVTVDGKPHAVSAEALGAHRNVPETVQAAWNAGRAGSVLGRLSEIFALRAHPKNFEFQTAYDETLLAGIADGIAKESAVPASNAALKFLPASDPPFSYAGETPGRQVDRGMLYNQMKAGLGGSGPSVITLSTSLLAPDVTVAGLKAQTQLIGTFTTALIPDAVRNQNITLAANAVSGAVLWPGDEFSFNGRTGERTQEKGYRDATAIVNGQLADETGGGVCQVATTVYNAALLAGLTVDERHAHSRPMVYVDAGRDATVDFPSFKDLRLKNISGFPVYLIVRVDVANNLLTADFYGSPPADSISVETENYQALMPDKPIELTNPDKPIGWSNTLVEARAGCSVSVYRVFTNGTNMRKELISNDTYAPQQGKIEIGTKPPSEKGK